MDERILEILRENQDYISGEELANQLGVTRAAVHKHVDKLRSEGYDICAQPHLGYKLLKIPDRLTSEEISWQLNTKIVGTKIYSYQKTSSTMDVAHKLAESETPRKNAPHLRGTPDGTCVFAEEQAKGRGRMGRAWTSPKGVGIYFSLILYPDILPQEAPKLTLLAAVSVACAIRKVTPLLALIKWPNDILVNHRKVCGILIELDAELDRTRFLILGIGINVNAKREDLPKGGSSLKEELGEEVSRIEIAKEILRELDRNYIIFKEKGFEPIIKVWREYSATLGLRVRVFCHGKKIEGQAMDVDENGALLVRRDGGFVERILAGDVVILR